MSMYIMLQRRVMAPVYVNCRLLNLHHKSRLYAPDFHPCHSLCKNNPALSQSPFSGKRLQIKEMTHIYKDAYNTRQNNGSQGERFLKSVLLPGKKKNHWHKSHNEMCHFLLSRLLWSYPLPHCPKHKAFSILLHFSISFHRDRSKIAVRPYHRCRVLSVPGLSTETHFRAKPLSLWHR